MTDSDVTGVASCLATVLAALEATPPSIERALDAALEAWRITRQPAVADVVDRLSARWSSETRSKKPAIYASSLRASWMLARHKFQEPREGEDPRVARALFRVLFEREMFQGTRARSDGEVEEFSARLAALGDVRFANALRTTLASATAFPGTAAAGRARPLYEAALASLDQRRAELAPMDPELAALLGRIVALLPDQARRGSAVAAKFVSASAAEVIAAVFAAPDDDDLRRVVGDRLIELDDPRGEFIALSFAELDGTLGPDGKKRMSVLFNKHAGNWSADVAPIGTRDGMRFERGFLAEVSLDKSTIGLNREMWDAALESPYWATVIQLNVSERVPDWWLRAFLQSPWSARLSRLVIRPKRGKPDIVLERPRGSAPGALFHLVAAAKQRTGFDRALDKFAKALVAMTPSQLEVFEQDAHKLGVPQVTAAIEAALAKLARPAK